MIPYCDGALHQGYVAKPVKYKDANLYFRGAINTRAHFGYLDSVHGLFRAQKVILTGGSAGAVAVMQWNNYLRSKLINPEALYLIPDSGVFLDVETVGKERRLSIALANTYRVANID